MAPSSSPSGPERLDALRRYDILEYPHEDALDRVVGLAARLLGAPMAGIHFVDGDRQWTKAHVGMDVPRVGLDVSFCARELGAEDVLVVQDAAADPRFADHPLVTGEPHVRFCAGAALTTPEGVAIGRLGVFDTYVRLAGKEDWKELRELAPEEGERRYLQRVQLTKDKAYGPVNLALCHKAGEDDPWLIATDQEAHYLTLRTYSRQRRNFCDWIEQLFADFEGGGFPLATGHFLMMVQK